MKVAYVLSYKYPKYVRTRFLLQLLNRLDNIQVVTAINNSKGPLRYVQTIAKLVKLRLIDRPDVYILGFRGAELYWLVRLITHGKPLIYDEFLNPYLWVVEEHKKFKPNSILAKLIRWYVGYCLRSADAILSDTDAHARYSSERFNVGIDKFTTLYVGTDEELFKIPAKSHSESRAVFNVFFYGNFLPLHGINLIVDAADQLRDLSDIHFTIIGGAKRKQDMNVFLEDIKSRKLHNISHEPGVPFKDLPKYILESDLCLGGPFGGTPQAQKVITGKTYQFFSLAKPTVIGRTNEEVGLIDKVNCLLVDQASAEKLAETIKWAYDNREKLDNIGEAGRSLYDSTFSQVSQLSKFELVLRQLTKS